MKNIVLAANEWCKRSRTKAQMALDVLHVLIEYSEMLRRNDADWHTKWTNNRVASARGLSMVLVGKGGLLPDSEASALVHYAESQFRALQETQ